VPSDGVIVLRRKTREVGCDEAKPLDGVWITALCLYLGGRKCLLVCFCLYEKRTLSHRPPCSGSERSEASVAARGAGFQENGHASSVGNIVAAKLVALECEDKREDVIVLCNSSAPLTAPM